MKIEPTEIYSEMPNFAVVRIPSRSFPGSVIQGDSLSILLGHAQVVCDKVKGSIDEDLVESAHELLWNLQARLDHYERVLTSHGIKLPYAKQGDGT